MKIDEDREWFISHGLRDTEADAAMAVLMGQAFLVYRLSKLEAVAEAARVAVAMWHDIGAGTKWALCDETQALADALDALDKEGR